MSVLINLSQESMQSLRKKRTQLSNELSNIYAQINALQYHCKHQFRPLTESELKDEWMSISARCEICDKDFGWRCKESPNQYCETDDYNDCIYCGQPDERK